MTQEKVELNVRTAVRDRYSKIAETFEAGTPADCGCNTSPTSCCGDSEADARDEVVHLAAIEKFYKETDADTLPEEVTGLSLGCGDPVTLAALTPGQTVLDLGSGGGIDCFLAGQRVGPEGHVIGVDMTPAMLEKARANKAKIGADNVEFRLGEIEHLPVSDASIDVIISNCVINLSTDKPQVFREMYRAMRPGGKLAVSDMVTDGKLPDGLTDSLSAWAGCVAGALDVEEYISGIKEVGFVDVEIVPVYLDRDQIDDAVRQLGGEIQLGGLSKEAVYKAVFSAKITARKPM
ncbi:MAG: arsenite methyltransferase [Anaerolineae bacterium]|jgi:arsenite methyltransferase|nr:arsenite methyltransferase [Anaerolineae bacterium]MBT7073183.1 arsenite methyltransferase [Anaerolineae bacterium]MBT7324088.1 arsenite methyltransferase [Anaerolineae bacterium]